MVLFRLRFFDDLKSTFITEWTLCKGKPFQTLLEFYSDIQNGDVKCGYSYENACSYDVDELWAEYAGSGKPQPVFIGDEKEFCRVSSLDFTLGDLADDVSSRKRGLFIIFHVKPHSSIESQSANPGPSCSSSQVESQSDIVLAEVLPKTKNAFYVMKNSCNELCVPDKKKGKNKNVAQFNKIIDFLEKENYKVQRRDVRDYVKFVELIAKVLWSIDPHQKQFESRCLHLSRDVKNFFGFNNPSSHKHKIEPLNSRDMQHHVNSLSEFCMRQYMLPKRMYGLKNIVTMLCETIQTYIDYLQGQMKRNDKNRTQCQTKEPTLDEFKATRLRVKSTQDSHDKATFEKLEHALNEIGFYVPLVINEHLDRSNRHSFNKSIQKLKLDGLPFCIDSAITPCHPSGPTAQFTFCGSSLHQVELMQSTLSSYQAFEKRNKIFTATKLENF